MNWDIVAYVLLVFGAVVGYQGDKVYKLLMRNRLNEKQTAVIKLIGLLIVVAGVLLIFKK